MSATHSVGPGPTARWHRPSATYNRSYLVDLLRAGLIAALLLGILAVIVWF